MLHRLVTLVGSIVLASTALAGEVSGRGPNGGRLADVTGMHVEFVTKGTEISVFTFDHDNKPVPSEGMTGRVTIQESGKTRTATLTPEAPNRLSGRLETPLATSARVVVSLTPKGGKPVQARYTAN